jgi:hypothetical protein
MTRRIGFIGLGAMGEPMATRLVLKGFDVTVVGHRRRDPVERLVALGAKEAHNASALAASSDVVVSMLPGSDAIERVVLGSGGVLAALKPHATLVDCSTAERRPRRDRRRPAPARRR